MTDEKRLTEYYKEVERFMEAYELALITNQPFPKRPSYKKKPLFMNLTPIYKIRKTATGVSIYTYDELRAKALRKLDEFELSMNKEEFKIMEEDG